MEGYKHITDIRALANIDSGPLVHLSRVSYEIEGAPNMFAPQHVRFTLQKSKGQLCGAKVEALR